MLGQSKDRESHSETAREHLEERIRWATATLFAGECSNIRGTISWIDAFVMYGVAGTDTVRDLLSHSTLMFLS